MAVVLLTGATGTMGSAVLAHLREREIRTRVLLRPGSSQRVRADETIDVVIGDLTEPASVTAALAGVDLVLHVAGAVSPFADEHPEIAAAVNVGGARNLVSAIRHHGSRAALVGIGSVAEYGNRTVPRHWGRVGDPLAPSLFDHYAQTKIQAERVVVDSGLPRWMWLRQTGIFHPDVLRRLDPIMTHGPLDGVLEWVSDEDSGRLLTAIAAGEAPEEAWNRVFNIGGGEDWRMTNFEFYLRLGHALGVRDIRRWFRRDWFALQNFHGMWFSDSDDLERLIPFRAESFEAALLRCVAAAPRGARLAPYAPGWFMRGLVTGPVVRARRGTIRAIRDGDEAAIRAAYGSRDAYEAIGDWSEYEPIQPSREPSKLNHGFDESLPESAWDARVLEEAAAFRGGTWRGHAAEESDVGAMEERHGAAGAAWTRRLHRWACAFGHEFEASPYLVLGAGHWCPECVQHPEDFPLQAGRNPFLAQVVDA